jgi:hypothetical protein
MRVVLHGCRRCGGDMFPDPEGKGVFACLLCGYQASFASVVRTPAMTPASNKEPSRRQIREEQMVA